MTKHLHASPLTLLFFRIGIAPLVVPILALTLYGQAFYGSVVGTMTATYAQVINEVPNVTRNLLFYAILQNGAQSRNQTSTSTLGDL
jgi:hypothetical protein